jgi:hypothetical protein
MPHLVTGGHPPPPLMSLGPSPTDRKDYYDSYNRYFRLNSIFIHVHYAMQIYRHVYAISLLKQKDSETMAVELYKSDMLYKFNYLVSEKCQRTEMFLQVTLTMHI